VNRPCAHVLLLFQINLQASSAANRVVNHDDLPALLSDSDDSDDSDHLPSSAIAAPASATQAVAAAVALRVVHQRIAAAAIEDNSATVLVCIAPAHTFIFLHSYCRPHPQPSVLPTAKMICPLY
jgi:hypothetical protein